MKAQLIWTIVLLHACRLPGTSENSSDAELFASSSDDAGSAKIIAASTSYGGQSQPSATARLRHFKTWSINAKRIDSESSSSIAIGRIVSDSKGSLIATGSAHGSFNLGGGLTVADSRFVAKYAASGQAQWVVAPSCRYSNGRSGSPSIAGLAVDKDDNILISGHFSPMFDSRSKRQLPLVCDFGNGITLSGSLEKGEPFVAKLNQSSRVLWARLTPSPGPTGHSVSHLAATASGSIFGVGSDSMPRFALAADGNLLWSDSPPPSRHDYAIADDKRGGILVASWGATPHDLLFNVSSTGTASTVGLAIDYSSGGQIGSMSKSGPCLQHAFQAIAASSKDDSRYTAGWICGNTSVSFGNGLTVSGNAIGKRTAVVVKHSSQGSWARTVVGPGDSWFSDLAVRRDGTIVVAGTVAYDGVYSFGSEVTAKGLSSTNYTSGVLVHYGSSGEAIEALTTGSFSNSQLSLDSEDNVFVSGDETSGLIHKFELRPSP